MTFLQGVDFTALRWYIVPDLPVRKSRNRRSSEAHRYFSLRCFETPEAACSVPEGSTLLPTCARQPSADGKRKLAATTEEATRRRGYIREPTGSAAVSEPQLRPEGLLSVPAIPPVVRRGDSLLSRPAASTGRSRVVVVVRTVHLSPQTHGCADAISGLGLEQHAPRRRCPTILRVPSLPGGARAAPSRGGKKSYTACGRPLQKSRSSSSQRLGVADWYME